MKHIITVILAIGCLSSMAADLEDLNGKGREALIEGDYIEAVEMYSRAAALAPADAAVSAALQDAKLQLQEAMGTVSAERLQTLLSELDEIEKTRAEALAAEVDRLEAEIASLQLRLSGRPVEVKVQEDPEELARFRDRLQELRIENEELIDRLRRARSEVATAEAQKGALEARIKVLNREVEDWEDHGSEGATRNLSRKLDEQKESIRELEKKLEDAETDKRRLVAQLEFIRKEQQDRASARKKIQDDSAGLQEENVDLRRRVRRLEHELDRARKEIEDLRSKPGKQAEAPAARNETAKLTSELDAQAEVVERLNRQLESMDANRTTLSEKVDETGDAESEAQKRLQRMDEEQKAAADDIEALKAKLEALGAGE